MPLCLPALLPVPCFALPALSTGACIAHPCIGRTSTCHNMLPCFTCLLYSVPSLLLQGRDLGLGSTPSLRSHLSCCRAMLLYLCHSSAWEGRPPASSLLCPLFLPAYLLRLLVCVGAAGRFLPLLTPAQFSSMLAACGHCLCRADTGILLWKRTLCYFHLLFASSFAAEHGRWRNAGATCGLRAGGVFDRTTACLPSCTSIRPLRYLLLALDVFVGRTGVAFCAPGLRGAGTFSAAFGVPLPRAVVLNAALGRRQRLPNAYAAARRIWRGGRRTGGAGLSTSPRPVPRLSLPACRALSPSSAARLYLCHLPAERRPSVAYCRRCVASPGRRDMPRRAGKDLCAARRAGALTLSPFFDCGGYSACPFCCSSSLSFI